jgi:hypothetical protein
MEQTLLNDYLLRLDGLIRNGRELQALVVTDRSNRTTVAAIRSWQQMCAETVNALSGGSKAHWLAQAFSQAFLVRSIAGEVVEQAPLGDIVDRIVGTLEQAARSLSQKAAAPAASNAAAPRPHRFEFVHNAALRPLLEQAYDAARTALEQGHFGQSLLTTCGVLEAVITDALEHVGRDAHAWSFDARIAAAEQAGLIRGGCARLPALARSYRERIDANGTLPDDATVTARDARVTRQVLEVVIRDLDPGR